MSSMITVVKEVYGKSTHTRVNINMHTLSQFMEWDNYKLVTVGEDYYGIQLIEGVNMKADDANRRLGKLDNGHYYQFYNDNDNNLYIAQSGHTKETQGVINTWSEKHSKSHNIASTIIDKIKAGNQLTEDEQNIINTINPELLNMIK